MKKIYLSFLLVLLPLFASADPVEIYGIYYNLVAKGNAAEVTYEAKNATMAFAVTLPSTSAYQVTIVNPKDASSASTRSLENGLKLFTDKQKVLMMKL